MVLYPPFTQYSFLKQGAWGQWMKMWLGITALAATVKSMSHCSPRPLFMAWLSSQSTSPPSRLFSRMNFPNLVPQVVASAPAEVGFSLSPKALTRILIPAALQRLLSFFWISWVVFPKELPQEKQRQALDQIIAISLGLPAQLQKARMSRLQSWGAAQPGTPSPLAMESPYQEEVRSMQAARMGQVSPLSLSSGFCVMVNVCAQARSRSSSASLYML